ncbi:MAG: hypothetical protein EBS05_04875 [Proteobacteria bacterium]|nr:hypothetical protein [Pseudomonadota bacterium]
MNRKQPMTTFAHGESCTRVIILTCIELEEHLGLIYDNHELIELNTVILRARTGGGKHGFGSMGFQAAGWLGRFGHNDG